jgi:hypothetical protein
MEERRQTIIAATDEMCASDKAVRPQVFFNRLNDTRRRRC